MSRRPLGAWLFGKLPAHGDFVARGLDIALRDALDAWLARSLAQARESWGAGFEERYFAAPPWAFVDCDPDGALSGGAICLSVDSVGRKFPFLLAAPAADEAEAERTSLACLDAASTAIAEGWEADRALAAAPAAAPGEAVPARATARWMLPSLEKEPIAAVEGRFPEGLIGAMLEQAA